MSNITATARLQNPMEQFRYSFCRYFRTASCTLGMVNNGQCCFAAQPTHLPNCIVKTDGFQWIGQSHGQVLHLPLVCRVSFLSGSIDESSEDVAGDTRKSSPGRHAAAYFINGTVSSSSCSTGFGHRLV